MTHHLIAHSLIRHAGQYLIIKRSAIKRGKPNVYPSCWDIPGGRVEAGELPREAALRECLEEVGLGIRLGDIIHEDSNRDGEAVFTRLVYSAQVCQPEPLRICLDPEEHVDYRWVDGLSDLDQLPIVPYVRELLTNALGR